MWPKDYLLSYLLIERRASPLLLKSDTPLSRVAPELDRRPCPGTHLFTARAERAINRSIDRLSLNDTHSAIHSVVARAAIQQRFVSPVARH